MADETQSHLKETEVAYQAISSFPALRDARLPASRIAATLEPYLRLIVERIHPDKIVLFGSYAYGTPTEHSDFDLLVVRRGLHLQRKATWRFGARFGTRPPHLRRSHFCRKRPKAWRKNSVLAVSSTAKSLTGALRSMLHRQTNDRDPADWFAFAEERLRGADVLRKSEGVTALGIEALQEATERYLKGFLIARGWVLIKTHDLERLIDEASKFDQRFAGFLAFAIELTEDFFGQHYPGGDMTAVGQNYDPLRQQAAEMITLVEQSLPQYFSKPSTK